jgi:drug/metabolite transporter (DMT)-like permease
MNNDRVSVPAPAAAAASGAPRMSAAEWGLVAALAFIWGGSFFFNKVLLGALEPLTIVLGRVGLAALALVGVIYAMGARLPLTLRAWRTFAAMSLLNNLLPFALILNGQKEIASGLAAILNATTPLFTAVLAHVLAAGERLTAHRLAGVFIGFAGVVVMMGPDVLVAGLGGSVVAQLSVLAAAVCYAFSGIYGRRLGALGIAPQTAAAGQLTVSTILILPIALLVDRPWTLAMPGLEIWAALFGLALVSTALAYVIFFRLLSGAGAVNTALVTLLVPVTALLLGTLILGEAFTLREAAGMAVILAGLVVTDGRALALLRTGRTGP